MNCLIIDKVWGGIAEELSKCMNVKTADNLPSSKEQLIAEIGDVDVLIMRVDPKIDKEILDAAKNLKVIGRLLRWFKPYRYGICEIQRNSGIQRTGLKRKRSSRVNNFQDVRHLPWNLYSKLRCKI